MNYMALFLRDGSSVVREEIYPGAPDMNDEENYALVCAAASLDCEDGEWLEEVFPIE